MARPQSKTTIVNTAIIKARREHLKLTMDEAAKRAGFGGRQQWNAVESGERKNPSIETMRAVATTLLCPIEDLLLSPAKPQK